MRLREFLLNYGEKVPGYDVTVINEREARAAAGIQFMLGMLVIFVGIGFNHTLVARIFLAFLFIDFTIRLITPRYSPILLLGKFFVRRQKPEYVGGLQKRFAWTIGWLILIPLQWWFVINWDISFYKVLLCVVCLVFMFLESAFSICIGCWMYRVVTKKSPTLCPGGVCEMKTKEPTVRYTPVQAVIAGATFIALMVGTYLFLAYSKPQTFFGEFLHELVLTDAQLAAEEEAELAKAFDEEDDDF